MSFGLVDGTSVCCLPLCFDWSYYLVPFGLILLLQSFSIPFNGWSLICGQRSCQLSLHDVILPLVTMTIPLVFSCLLIVFVNGLKNVEVSGIRGRGIIDITILSYAISQTMDVVDHHLVTNLANGSIDLGHHADHIHDHSQSPYQSD